MDGERQIRTLTAANIALQAGGRRKSLHQEEHPTDESGTCPECYCKGYEEAEATHAAALKALEEQAGLATEMASSYRARNKNFQPTWMRNWLTRYDEVSEAGIRS